MAGSRTNVTATVMLIAYGLSTIDYPWIVVHGDSLKSIDSNLEEMLEEAPKEILCAS